MRWRRERARVGVVLAVALICLLGACSTPSPDPAPTASEVRSGSGELRHDLEPITERFPRVESAAAATWMSGTLGDERVPGPSTYWIDAVVTLDESDYAELQAEGDAQPTTEIPAVDAGLEDEVPDGPFLRSDALDGLFSPDGYDSSVYLGGDGVTIVVMSRFQ